VAESGAVRVQRVVSAGDCGTAVNPDGVRAMLEGAVNYALTPVLAGEITFAEGAVKESNFHDYRVLRIADAPDIEVHIVPSTLPPEGMGEPGVPPLAPEPAAEKARGSVCKPRALDGAFPSRPKRSKGISAPERELRFFGDCAPKKWPLRAACQWVWGVYREGPVFLGGLGGFARDHSLSPLTMRVMPFLIRTTLKLMSSPRRLSASFR